MSKPVCLIICASVVLLLGATPQRSQFSKYRAVEAYEIRPGILVIPTYANDGSVCEAGIEKLHYSHHAINLDSTLSPTVLNQIVDELAPPDMRGKSKSELGRDAVDEDGPSISTSVEYENISVQMFANERSASAEGDIVSTIRWKHRQCE
jgi:hypothetical protein